MRILIYGINYSPDLTGIGKYSGEMGSWLVLNGHEVTVITAMPYYPQWEVMSKYKGKLWHSENIDGAKVYRCPLYVPAKPSGAKRLLHDASFSISSFFVFFRLLFAKKNDLLITVAPPFHLGLMALIYRFFKGTKVLYHIQDLQVDAAKELGMIKSKKLLNILVRLERFIIKRVDYVSSISPGMIAKIKLKVSRKIVEFPNWVDLTRNFPIEQKDRLKSTWGYSPNQKVILYSGNIGEKQGLGDLLNVAQRFAGNSNVRFVICGNGAYKEDLIELAQKMALTNIDFLPLQGNDIFNAFLNMADIHLILQKGDASDLVMPSKLTTILAVGGIALVTANSGTSLYEVISQNEIGFVAEPENPESLYKQIKLILATNNTELGARARKFAENNLSQNHILDNLFNSFDIN